MPETATFRRHAALVDRMASTIGIDLEEKVMEGQLDFNGVSDAVLNCSGCCCTGACEIWLDAFVGGADAPPPICRNREMFGRLKAGKRA
ncbi:MAG TPA: DUF6455 family protein [Roseovarius sp.]|nr:DUF6455 family protein [Roseovarius sp.]